MEPEDAAELIHDTQELIQQFLDEPAKVPEDLLDLHPATIAEAMQDMESDEVHQVLQVLPEELSGEVFANLEPDAQEDYAEDLSNTELGQLMTTLPADDAADLARRLPEDMVDAAYATMDQEERQDIENLAAYAPGTIGAVMTSEFALLPLGIDAALALGLLRQEAVDAETILVSFVVDEHDQLVGTVSLEKLVLASPHTPILEIMKTQLVSVLDTDDQELAASKIADFDLLVLPVVDAQDRLVGIVTHDDIMDVVSQEHTEDMEKFMGIGGKHEDNAYLRTPILTHFQNRIGWIVAMSLLGLISGLVLKGFEDILSSLVILTLFLPMLANTSGNMGSQSASVIIRALSLQEISLKDAWRVLFRELSVSVLSSLVLAGVTIGRVLLMGADANLPHGMSLIMVGITIALALTIQILTATTIGSLLPMIAKRFGLDPAVIASPAITTIVDITGIFVYFSLARLILGI